MSRSSNAYQILNASKCIKESTIIIFQNFFKTTIYPRNIDFFYLRQILSPEKPTATGSTTTNHHENLEFCSERVYRNITSTTPFWVCRNTNAKIDKYAFSSCIST